MMIRGMGPQPNLPGISGHSALRAGHFFLLHICLMFRSGLASNGHDDCGRRIWDAAKVDQPPFSL